MDLLNRSINRVKTPSPTDKIYKDECVFCFDTPDSPNGLYICLNTFLGFGRDFVEMHHKTTGNSIFLNLRRIAHEIPGCECEESKPKITKLAIGVDGGFNVDKAQQKYTYEEINSVVVLPEFAVIPLPNPNLPEQLLQSISMVLAADAAFKMEELQAISGSWDGEKRKVSKHALNLVQLDNGVKIPPKGWKCQSCDKKENLWLNLTDGSILCGRKFFDGSGGNNHALEYYGQKKYPLAVKLGTITPDGADVYSYDEDDMVEDPDLAKHLTHFGINISSMQKTDKSMIELEIDLNQRYDEWSIIQEEGCSLSPLCGAGYTGLVNLGNSCYLNSVMQVMFSIPDFQERYYPPYEIFKSSTDPPNDFTTQMAKLAYGLLSGKYSETNSKTGEQTGIKPTMFKNLIGKGHHEFSTKRQQDVQEFFLHLINFIERNNRRSSSKLASDCFKFQVEERIECVQSKKVTYNTRTEYMLSLPVSKDISNLEEYLTFESKKKELEQIGQKIDSKDVVRPIISIESCVEEFAEPTIIDDFFSSALNSKSTAKQLFRLRSFPDYLMVHIKKFALGEDWVPKKLDISLNVPDVLNLEHLRGFGLQPGEEQLPGNSDNPQLSETSSVRAFEFNQTVLAQLSEMGFPIEGCKRALFNTKNADLETATNWIMEHMTDPDFSEPFLIDEPQSSKPKNPQSFTADPEAMTTIVSMGFSEDQAFHALKATNNNLERAIDWIFSHVDELESSNANAMQVEYFPNTGEQTESSNANTIFRDGSGKYKLIAFISHMGSSTMCGHYVCHILKDDRWAIFNDNKVAISEHPPKDLAYMYLYKRL